MSIDPIPDIIKYPHILSAYKNKKLVIFLGAGISALWGCKRWKEMAISLIETCYEYGKINYWTHESLLAKHSHSPRKLITIARKILEQDYFEVLKQTLNCSAEKQKKLPDLFKNLFDLDAIYITTNIDDNFSKMFDNTKVHADHNSFYCSILEAKNIIHLHGNINRPETIVLTLDEYLIRYQDDNFTTFLKSTFFDKNYCFLFLGYGVDELEIIDFLIEKYDKKEQQKDLINHSYILLPFFKNEEQLLNFEQLYFNTINMSIIPYAIDEHGYEQLDEVIGTWKKGLKEEPEIDFYKNIKLIESNL